MTGEELRKLREEHGLTQKALGELLGYTGNYIYRLEKGGGSKEDLGMTKRFEKLVRAILGRKKMPKHS